MGSGGKREGAGRKAVLPNEKRKKVSITLSPEAYAVLQDLRSRKVKVGKLLDDFLLSL